MKKPAIQDLTPLLAVLAIEIVIFGATTPYFLSWANGIEIIRFSVELGLLAVALTPVIVTGGIDLSVGAMMGLAAVSFGPSGSVRTQKVVDTDVCSCCSTDIGFTAKGPVAVYRDHLPGEIRDISIVRRVHGVWTEPVPVHRDGWRIPGCPTNGPALSARGSRVAVAWFTAAGDTPRLKVAVSEDSGATFGDPIVIDEGRPVGWPDLEMLEDGTALVSWLERRGEGVGEILVRRIGTDRRPGPAISVARASSGRATGMPHMVRVGDRLLLAWRNERVLTATVPIAAIQP